MWRPIDIIASQKRNNNRRDSDRRMAGWLAAVAIFAATDGGSTRGANQCNSYTIIYSIFNFYFYSQHKLRFQFFFVSPFVYPIRFCFAFVGSSAREGSIEVKWTWNVVKMTNECNLFSLGLGLGAAFDIYFLDAHRLFYFRFASFRLPHLAQQFFRANAVRSYDSLHCKMAAIWNACSKSYEYTHRARTPQTKRYICKLQAHNVRRPKATSSEPNETSYSNHVRERSQVDNINCIERISRSQQPTSDRSKDVAILSRYAIFVSQSNERLGQARVVQQLKILKQTAKRSSFLSRFVLSDFFFFKFAAKFTPSHPNSHTAPSLLLNSLLHTYAVCLNEVLP